LKELAVNLSEIVLISPVSVNMHARHISGSVVYCIAQIKVLLMATNTGHQVELSPVQNITG
jgi:hypothetical protein